MSKQYAIFKFDVTGLSDEQKGLLAGEVEAQHEATDDDGFHGGKPDVPAPEISFVTEEGPVGHTFTFVITVARGDSLEEDRAYLEGCLRVGDDDNRILEIEIHDEDMVVSR